MLLAHHLRLILDRCDGGCGQSRRHVIRRCGAIDNPRTGLGFRCKRCQRKQSGKEKIGAGRSGKCELHESVPPGSVDCYWCTGEPGGPGAPCGSSGLGGTAPTAGQLYYGGNGAGSDPAPAGDGATAEGGGGGGGGYYGGGGGRCAVYASGPPDGAGGGGSGYIGAAAVTHAYSIAGTGAVEAGLDRGAPPARAAVRSPFYRSGIGWGGGQSGAGSGGNGQLVLEWGHDRHPRPKATPVPGPAPAATPTVAVSPAPRRPMLPDTGFPFALAGMAVLILAGLGAAARRAGRGRQRP